MAEIISFRGVRYDPARINGTLADVVAPPYDVISPAEQEALHAQSPYNVARLTLGQGEDKYDTAARLFRQWLGEGVLVKEDEEAMYVYRQSFRDPITGAACPERNGLACLLKLEEYEAGTVLPHENTLTGAKRDRLALMQATGAQFESIFGLYSDPDRAVQSFLGEWDDRESVMEAVPDAIGSSHAVERIRDEDAIEALRSLMADKQIFIADGHHRYETALQYRRDARAARGVPPDAVIPEDFILITLTAFEDEGLLVLPTHRVVQGVAPDVLAALPQRLAGEFVTEPLAGGAGEWERALADKSRGGAVAFAVMVAGASPVLATWNSLPGDAPQAAGDVSANALSRLPVTVLHSRILEPLLGIGADALAAGGQVTYTRNAAEAEAQVRGGAAQAAFLLARPGANDVRNVSLAGSRMPQKSTFFFPKLLSGLLLRDLQEETDGLTKT